MTNNDFTKSELSQLFDWALKTQQCCGDCSDPALMAKLETMIDNYCEHDFEKSYKLEETECCTKCGLQAI